MRKKLMLAMIGLFMLSLACPAQAVDFKLRTQFMVGVGIADTNMVSNYRDANGVKHNTTSDKVEGGQRIRALLETIISEALSGSVQFQISHPYQNWGNANSGAALGADGTVVALRRAYIDFMPPDTGLKVRMGIQGLGVPYTAGGSVILENQVAGVSASYQINDNVGLSGFWARPANDNFLGDENSDGKRDNAGYLDNIDLFALTVPLKWDGYKITPWFMYGLRGRNALNGLRGFNGGSSWSTQDGNMNFTLNPYPAITGRDHISLTTKPWGNMFWFGVPIEISAFDPWRFEFDFQYGYTESMGKYNATKFDGPGYNTPHIKRANTKREGWIAKGLIEYAFDWGIPGVLGWYSSGDSSDPSDGSGRIPTFVGWGTFSSFMGDGDAHSWRFRDINSTYTGTWGVGARIRDVSFIDKVDHDFTVIYWGGTNSPEMAKYMKNAYAWQDGSYQFDGPYMTTNDGLLEFNLNTNYKMYENLNVNLSMGYIANYMDNSTWNKAGHHNTSFTRQDIWKAHLVFEYHF